MIKLSTTQIAELTGGKLHGHECVVRGISIDSRTLRNGDLFVAVSGARYDGQDFIEDAYRKGACAVMVQNNIKSDLPWIFVKDSREALGRLAKFCRHHFSGVVFGITGSNGKTTVKELLKSILSNTGTVLATHGNQNNDIGVPLTIFNLLHSNYDYVVIEMGSNHLGEIDYLARIVQPDIAILTSIGQAHLSGFRDIHGVIKEKVSVFDHLNPDSKYCYGVIGEGYGNYPYMKDRLKDFNIRTFGMGPQAQFRAIECHASESGEIDQTVCCIQSDEYLLKSRTSLLGKHNRMNIAAAIAAVSGLDIGKEEVIKGVECCTAPAGRLQLKELQSGGRVIDDTYNANPSSVKMAIDVLANLEGEKNLIMGEMRELGNDPDRQYLELGHYARLKGVHRLMACGQETQPMVEGFGKEGYFFPDQTSLIAFLKKESNTDNRIKNFLVKGSRAAAMENVVQYLTGGGKDAIGTH